MFFDELERLLIAHDWKPNAGHSTTGFRKKQFSTSVGYTCHWAKPGRPILPSASMLKNPSIYNECRRLFPDFDFESVIINKNLLCPPHKDTNNIGDSLIIGLGDSPLIFNGSKLTHYTDEFEGDRYSVILFNSKLASRK